jgi:carboxymethylenebutenolidase
MSSADRSRVRPGIVLVGVAPGEGLRATLERYNARGYTAIAPDVVDASDVAGTLRAIEAARDALAAHAGANGNVAVAGYGHGGRYAYLAVTQLGADAGIAFHGIGIGLHLDEASKVKKPLSLHFADDDQFVPLAEVRAIKGALEGFATTEIYRYPGLHQGFAESGNPAYDEAGAREAERRAFEVLDRLR